jgi:hypothetical protein
MAPLLDIDRQTFGPLRLGDPAERANGFSQPGVEVEVIDGKVACFKFDVDAKSCVNVAGDIRLTRATKPLDAQVWFGEPASDSTGGGNLRWMDFERGSATLALEFDGGQLSCVQLYAEGYA